VRAAGLKQRTTAEWLAIFEARDVPAARYNSIDDLFADPHLADVGFFEREEHPSEGPIRRTMVANTFHGGMRENRLPAPRLGEHTRAVLAAVGYTAAEIEAMIASGAATASG
jgi:crotonobetainyl-CoA:carnitine CoA-transferase CaiB-like acyl-CoA transferase